MYGNYLIRENILGCSNVYFSDMNKYVCDMILPLFYLLGTYICFNFIIIILRLFFLNTLAEIHVSSLSSSKLNKNQELIL